MKLRNTWAVGTSRETMMVAMHLLVTVLLAVLGRFYESQGTTEGAWEPRVSKNTPAPPPAPLPAAVPLQAPEEHAPPNDRPPANEAQSPRVTECPQETRQPEDPEESPATAPSDVAPANPAEHDLIKDEDAGDDEEDAEPPSDFRKEPVEDPQFALPSR